MAETTEPIGERLKRLRTERGLSQRDISGPGVGSAYISRIEEGGRNPSLRALRVLAQKLGVTLEHLETGREIPLALEREYQLAAAELELRLDGDDRAAEQALRRLAGDDAREPICARARAALGIQAATRGDHEQAIEQLEAATAAGIRPRERPDVYETLASCHLARREGARAVALLERCLATTGADPLLQIRYRAQLGAILDASGDAQRARTLLDEAALLAEEHAHPTTRARHYRALAQAAWAEHRPDQALTHARRALALLEALEDASQLARTHLSCAELCNLDHEWVQALRHLDRADRLLEQTGDAKQLGLVRAEQAKACASTGATREALALAARAIALLSEDAPAAKHALAVAQAAAGDIESADESFLRAAETYEQRGQWRQAAAVAHDWGSALRRARRPEHALDAFSRAALYTARQWSGRSPSSPRPGPRG
jgi:transcriptional regulator with XRE-family HTH domain